MNRNKSKIDWDIVKDYIWLLIGILVAVFVIDSIDFVEWINKD